MALTPLYSVLVPAVTVTVATPGASQGAMTVPVEALAAGMPTGTILDFGSAKFAKLADDANEAATVLDTAPIPTDLAEGDEATYQPPSGSPLLSDAAQVLATNKPDKFLAEHLRAEMLLGLTVPVYEDTDAEELAFAVILQINYQVAHRNKVPDMKAVSSERGTESFRDRSVDPDAAMIVERVTGRRSVRYEPAGFGVRC